MGGETEGERGSAAGTVRWPLRLTRGPDIITLGGASRGKQMSIELLDTACATGPSTASDQANAV